MDRTVPLNPFASIGRTGMSKGKVKVRDMSKYLISDLIFQFFHSHMKKSSVFFKKKGLLIYLSSIKTKLAINFLEKTFALGQKQGWR